MDVLPNLIPHLANLLSWNYNTTQQQTKKKPKAVKYTRQKVTSFFLGIYNCAIVIWTIYLYIEFMYVWILFNSLSQEPPPHPVFESFHVPLLHLAKIVILLIYPPFVQIPMYIMKTDFKNIAEKKLGGGGESGCNNLPFWDGRGGNRNKYMFLQYLRHKVDFVGYFSYF